MSLRTTKSLSEKIDDGIDTINRSIDDGIDCVNKSIDDGLQEISDAFDNATQEASDFLVENGMDIIRSVSLFGNIARAVENNSIRDKMSTIQKHLEEQNSLPDYDQDLADKRASMAMSIMKPEEPVYDFDYGPRAQYV